MAQQSDTNASSSLQQRKKIMSNSSDSDPYGKLNDDKQQQAAVTAVLNSDSASPMRFLSVILLVFIISVFFVSAVIAFIWYYAVHLRSTDAIFDIQGHRGARALLPENTIPAFLLALDMGVDTLELDTVISKDSMVVVSHDPYLNPAICFTPTGNNITSLAEAKAQYNLYNMTYESEIAKCDCGSKGNPLFPTQKPMRVFKPLLSDLFDAVKAHMQEKGMTKTILYNIEIKSRLGFDGIEHPEPKRFAQLLLEVLKAKQVDKVTTVQSFDPRALQAMRELDPQISLSLLVQDDGTYGRPFDHKLALQNLGFKPQYYSPNYKLVNAELISFMKQQQIKVVPWTVNDPQVMLLMKSLQTDGLITDAPDIAMEFRKNGKL